MLRVDLCGTALYVFYVVIACWFVIRRCFLRCLFFSYYGFFVSPLVPYVMSFRLFFIVEIQIIIALHQ
jgi:hypothetical protein